MQHRLFSLIPLLLSATLLPGCSERQPPVRVASGGHILNFLPFDVAMAKGFFQEEGLDLEVTYLTGGTTTAQALLAGQVDFSLNAIDYAYKAAARGKSNLRMVALMNRVPGMVLVVDSRHRDTIQDIGDLVGKRLGVTSKGSGTHMVLNFLLAKKGVDPQAVTVVKAGTSTFPPALENGKIHGGIALEPFASILIEQGKVQVLADLRSMQNTIEVFGGPYNLAGIMTRQDIIARDPELVRRFVTAIVKALRWMSEHTPEDIAAVLLRTVTGSDLDRYIKILGKLREFYTLDGHIDPEGAHNVLKAMEFSGAFETEQNLNALDFITNDFLPMQVRSTSPSPP